MLITKAMVVVLVILYTMMGVVDRDRTMTTIYLRILRRRTAGFVDDGRKGDLLERRETALSE